MPWFKFLDNGEIVLRQHPAGDDDEDRFQADLKKAVRESLGICPLCLFHVHLLFMCASTVSNSVRLIYTHLLPQVYCFYYSLVYFEIRPHFLIWKHLFPVVIFHTCNIFSFNFEQSLPDLILFP